MSNLGIHYWHVLKKGGTLIPLTFPFFLNSGGDGSL